jgi:tetratricopeptide (TPR) repeat protein
VSTHRLDRQYFAEFFCPDGNILPRANNQAAFRLASFLLCISVRARKALKRQRAQQELQLRLSVIGFLALALSLFFTSQSALAAGVSAEISQVGDTVHLEFKGQNQWDYNIEKTSEKNSTTFELEVPALSEASLAALKKINNPFVEGLSVKHDGADGKDILVLKLKQKDLEAFDYLTDQPSRLIVDIYQNTKAAKASTAVEKQNPAVAPASNKKSTSSKKTAQLPKKGDRKPSSTDVLLINPQGPADAAGAASIQGTSDGGEEKLSGIFDGGDPKFERFQIKDYEIKEDAIIASRENYYLDFPMLRTESDELSRIEEKQPVYEITPKDSEENKQARLLLTLFQNKRYNVFLKTVEWFVEKYPNSEYDEMVRFMWADTHFAMWTKDHAAQDFELAMSRYTQNLEKYPKSPLAERTQMLMGFANMERGDYFASLRTFQKMAQDRPHSPNRDIARMAVADSLMKLARFDEAMKEYQGIAKDATSKKSQVEAIYYQGDVALKQGEFQKSIDLYKSALNKYPQDSVDYPNAYYNQALAYFRLKKPRESLNVFVEFLKRFPSHSYAGYAMTRVGELLDMMGADKARAIGAYLETQFRYGENPSAIVARLRLLQNRMRTMKPKEVEKAVDEFTALTKKTQFDRIDEFSKVLISDGYVSRGEYEKAIALLVKYYQENPTTANANLIQRRIVKDINLEIKGLIDNGNFMQALATHNKYADNWLKGSDRIDTKYNVARAFEAAGVFTESEKLYRDSLNKLTALKGTPEEKITSVFEKLPSIDELELRLASTEMQLGKNVQAYEHMRAIKNPELLSDDQQIERVQLGSRLLEKKGDLSSATRYLVELIKTWKGIPELVADPYLQLGELELKQGKKDDAIQSFQRVDQLMQDSQGKVAADTHRHALEQLGNTYFDEGKSAKSLEVYEKLLQKYENTKPLASVRYKVGSIYFKRGDMQKAADVWNGLKSDKNEVWYNIAQEQLKNSEWNGEYKKYIQRIPAMSGKNE